MIQLNTERGWTRLEDVYDGGLQLLMDDGPEMRRAMHALALYARRRVLLCGLGLGMLAQLCAEKAGVSAVDVVELREDVIRLCKTTHPKIRVICAEIGAFLEATPTWPWDIAIFDFHGDTSPQHRENVFVPVRQTVVRRFGNRRVVFWAEGAYG